MLCGSLKLKKINSTLCKSYAKIKGKRFVFFSLAGDNED